MDRQELLALYDREERMAVTFPDMRREASDRVVRLAPLAPKRGFRDGVVIYSRLDEATVEPAIDQQMQAFAALGVNFEWKVFDHDTPADLRQRLLARGFESDEPEAIMALPLAQAPPALLAPPSHDVRLLDDPDVLDDVLAVQREVWQQEHSGLAGYLRDTMIQHPELLSVYVVYDQGRPVASSWLYHDPASPFAGLWGGSTLEEHRGRGIYTALLAARVQQALRRGAAYLTIDASPMSAPIVQRFGFIYLATAWACTWRAAPDTDAPILEGPDHGR